MKANLILELALLNMIVFMLKDSDLFDIPFYETYCGHQYMNLELFSICMIMMCSKENELE